MLNSAAYRAALKQQLAAGARSFAAARQAAVQAVGADPAMAALLSQPNNNLAVEYCRAILEQRAGMTPVPLPRRGANHGQTLEESGHAQFASASALRALWAEGGAEAVAPFVPEKAFELYKTAENDGAYTDFDAAGRCELALLRAACAKPEPFAAVRGVSEGLEHRLEHAVRQSTSLPQLLDALTTVRYPRARMRRRHGAGSAAGAAPAGSTEGRPAAAGAGVPSGVSLAGKAGPDRPRRCPDGGGTGSGQRLWGPVPGKPGPDGRNISSKKYLFDELTKNSGKKSAIPLL